MESVLAASIFHFGAHTVGDVKQLLAKKKYPHAVVAVDVRRIRASNFSG